jgi:hypothetical protein
MTYLKKEKMLTSLKGAFSVCTAGTKNTIPLKITQISLRPVLK